MRLDITVKFLASVILLIAALVDSGYAAQAALADCDGAHATLLHASSRDKADARAVWLNRSQIRWPKLAPAQAESPEFKLYFSERGGLQFTPGKPVRGADAAITLQAKFAPLAAEFSARFGYLDAIGVTLSVAPADQKQISQWQRGQLIVAQIAQGDDHVIDAAALQIAGFLDDVYASAEAIKGLGAVVLDDKNTTSFKLWAPTAQSVALCVYDGPKSGAKRVAPMQMDALTGVWNERLSGNLHGKYYRYLVDVYAPGVGLVRNLVTDPYSVSLSSDSQRSYIANLDAIDLAPKGWREQVRAPVLAHAVDMSIYELHVRDFSANDASVSTKNRGKYLAFTEAKSDGMRHLKALAQAGMTDVHLLPVFDFATVPETGCVSPKIPAAVADSEAQQELVVKNQKQDCFNWGYDPAHFGAPEGSYASDANDGAKRIIEFRAMVDALHRAGLRVGMDVVYNHTAASGQDARSVLDRIVPGYYQRLDANGVVERSTCCDNTATENRMMAKLMIDTAVRWVRDYRIDSFRFDLMGHQPKAAMLQLQAAVDKAAGRPVNLLGEGWNFGEVANSQRFVQAAQLDLAGSGIASFSDRARDAVRGGGCCDSGVDLLRNQGYINGLHYLPNASAPKAGPDSMQALLRSADLVRLGLAGSIKDFELTTFEDKTSTLAEIDYSGQPAGYVAQPGEVVNYVENHDNPTLFDINVLKLPVSTPAAERARVQMLAAATVAFSQGISYYHAGMEGLRSKSLDRNSFDSGDWFNRIDWRFSDNYFGSGLPPKTDNGTNYALYKPLLANSAIKPAADDIRWMRDAFFDLLRIRKSTRLLRLTTSEAIKRRLNFLNTGSTQIPTVLAAVLDGTDLADAGFSRLVYFINVDVVPHTIIAPDEAGKSYVLHPVQRAKNAADKRVLESRYDAGTGAFTVPARTAGVYVVELKGK